MESSTDEQQPHSECKDSRIPKLEEIESKVRKNKEKRTMSEIDLKRLCKKSNYVLYDHFHRGDVAKRNFRKDSGLYTYCCVSVIISFIFGLSIGIILMGSNSNQIDSNSDYTIRKLAAINSQKPIRTLNSNVKKTEQFDSRPQNTNFVDKFATVSFTGKTEHKYNKEVYPKGLTEDMKEILKDNKISRHKHTISNVNITFVPNDMTVLYDNIYWGPEVENSIPQGYGENTADIWEQYVNQSEVIKMETGCGRMQNRLVTFRDGIQACVRYRQNTDQIQGEIFSFYVGRLLNLTNLAPSVVKVVDLKDTLWRNVANDIAAAQWSSNRAVVITQYIPSLESSTIPDIFKPSNRHLNKIDIYKMSSQENDTVETSKQILIDKLRAKNVKTNKKDIDNFGHIDMNLSKKSIKLFLELAQWSDLIIFDYLTANLDRIVNNLFNYQWNINIMDGPAHNLARKMDSGLLLFLDNESGLLHGYRLLKKYNVYHSLMLDNLCVFRKRTVDSLKSLYDMQSVGPKLSEMFHKKNNAIIRDILPPLPDKNAKILHERIGKVLNQVEKCEQKYR